MTHAMTLAAITAALRAALDGDDPGPLLDLLHPETRWAPTPGVEPALPSRAHILAWYAGLREHGARAAVEETFTYPDAVVLGLAHGTQDAPVLYQVFRITDGKITSVNGYADRYRALEAAYQDD